MDQKKLLRTSNIQKTYKIIGEVGAGTYGRVYKSKCLKSGNYVALKKIDMSKQGNEGFPITAIREIKILQLLDHPNIIQLKEIIMTKPSQQNRYIGSIYLVFDYMEHDFVGLTQIKYKFTQPQIRSILKQIISGMEFLKYKKILHRDLKSANVLFNNQGQVKIADFGLARQLSNHLEYNYTNKVVTLWYRSPELLLGAKDYTFQVDVWAVGCIFFELLTGEILFKGDKESRQLEIIYDICGKINNQIWPDAEKLPLYKEFGPKYQNERRIKEYTYSKKSNIETSCLELLDGMLQYDPKKRFTWQDCLNSVYLQGEVANDDQMPKLEKECHETLIKLQKEKGLDIKEIENYKNKIQKEQDNQYNKKSLPNYQNLTQKKFYKDKLNNSSYENSNKKEYQYNKFNESKTDDHISFRNFDNKFENKFNHHKYDNNKFENKFQNNFENKYDKFEHKFQNNFDNKQDILNYQTNEQKLESLINKPDEKQFNIQQLLSQQSKNQQNNQEESQLLDKLIQQNDQPIKRKSKLSQDMLQKKVKEF